MFFKALMLCSFVTTIDEDIREAMKAEPASKIVIVSKTRSRPGDVRHKMQEEQLLVESDGGGGQASQRSA